MKTLSEAIELVLGSTNQISLLLEKNAVKPVPATRTPKLKKKEIKEPQPIEPVKTEEVHTEPPVKDSEPLVAEQAPVELQAEPRTYFGTCPLNGPLTKCLVDRIFVLLPIGRVYRLVTLELILLLFT